MMPAISENELVARLASMLPRHPAQINKHQESDAELVRLPGAKNLVLAATTDAIVEEIESGLYSDPYLIGWMTVMANLSDLAAVGAEPIGILIEETFPQVVSESTIARLQKGISDACTSASTSVLGGDTNFSDRFITAGTALGLITDGKPMLRVHCAPGDIVYSTGPFGAGNAFAVLQFANGNAATLLFRPEARIKHGMSLRRHASVCMDTSDGLLATLDQLGRLNNVGFSLESPLDLIVDPTASRIAGSAGLRPWMLLAGPHGEFELVFTLPEHRSKAMMHAAGKAGWTPMRIGMVTQTPGITIPGLGNLTPEQMAAIRNYPLHSRDHVRGFLALLDEIEMTCRTSTEA
jgi:thiamine-monophosphate kinase